MLRVYRSESNKKIAGICGGIAEAYKIDANLVRVAVVFLGVATGGLPMLIAYVVGWIIIPPDSNRPSAGFSPPGQQESSR